MGAITIRKLDDAVVARLKARAKAAGRSMEEEARQILTQETGASASVGGRLHGQAAVDYFHRRREELFGDRTLRDTTNILRAIRDEDPTGSPSDEGGL